MNMIANNLYIACFVIFEKYETPSKKFSFLAFNGSRGLNVGNLTPPPYRGFCLLIMSLQSEALITFGVTFASFTVL